VEIIKTLALTEKQASQINDLWNEEYPLKLKDRFGILLMGAISYTHYLINDDCGNVAAWAVNFEKDNETRFSIIVNKNQQGKGLGTLLIARLKEELSEFYGWVIDHNNDKKSNGSYYLSPLSFYIKNGFEVLHDIRMDNDLLNAVKIRRVQQ
jgi:GNAT superfamily N-acetyltransferase